MKLTIYILTFTLSILTSCRQPNSKQKNEQKISTNTDTLNTELKNKEAELNTSQNLIERTDYQKKALDFAYEKAILFQLTDTITADFNGDGYLDKATLTKENETSGLIIKHGKNNEHIKIGFGKSFSTWEDFDLNWVDFWGLVNDSETYEIVIEDAEIIGERKVNLVNPSIVVRKEDAGGGLITFRNGKYEWIHQSD